MSIKAVNIKLRINPPPEILFETRYPVMSDSDAWENFRRTVPGYYPPSELYEAHDSHIYPETYQMSDTTKTDITLLWHYSYQLSKKPVLVFTTDGRDPVEYGRTVYLKEFEGQWINDYERSANVIPILTGYALPINIRAVLIDADNHSLVLTQASAVFTRESAKSVPEQHERLLAYCQQLLSDTDAEQKSINNEDRHGYLTLNEEYKSYDYLDPL